MKLGYAILYVSDVMTTVEFYEAAFGLSRKFVHESGQYGEMQTGATTLAFASLAMAAMNLPEGVRSDAMGPPAAVEITLVTAEVDAAFARAVAAGAAALVAPADKPWGQRVAYVRDLDGALVELASPLTEPAPRHVLTILAVTDLQRAASFYREAFGWPARVEVPVYVELELPDGRGLGLYERLSFGRNTGVVPAAVSGEAITGAEIYLHCDDLEERLLQLERLGARVLSPLAKRDWGDEAAYFADPDGNVVVVARPAPRRS